jgi:hypothetical protein
VEVFLKTSLLKGLNEKDKEEMKGLFIQSLRLRNQIIKTLEEKIRVIDAESVSKEGYESPSWAYKQADIVGYKRALKEIISLIEN